MFRYRDRRDGRQRDKGLGPYPDVKLAEARLLAAECRRQLLRGTDPIDSDRQARKAAKAVHAKSLPFGICAEQFIAAHEQSWRDRKHRGQWRSTIENHCTLLLDVPVTDIDTDLIYLTLKDLWFNATETARRTQSRIARILDWATVRGLRSGENPARWKGRLEHLLPSPQKLKSVQHRAAMPYGQLPVLMAQLRPRRELSALALQLQILTASRPGEATGARWEEINWDQRLWTVPAERTKTNTAHEVPLSEEVMDLFARVPRSAKPHLFPGVSNRPISTAATLKLLRGITPTEKWTCHGFRSSFRDWAAEKTSHERDVIEMSLAHKVANKVEAAYFRSKQLEKRARLMEDWGNYCGAQYPASPKNPADAD